MDEAAARYQKLTEISPDTGFPAYARFLARTGKTTEAAALLQDPRLEAMSPLARARTAVSAHLTSEAIAILRTPAQPGEEYQQALLLAGQLQLSGNKPAASEALSAAVQFPGHTDVQRRDLFRKLMRMGSPKDLQAALPLVVESLVTSASTTYPQLREMTVEALGLLAQLDGYAEYQHELDKNRSASPARGWLFSMAAIKRGDTAQARDQLENLTTASLTVPERLVVDEELASMLAGDPERQLQLYESLIPIAPDHHRLRVTVSQMLFRHRRYEKIASLLEPVDPLQLDDALLQVYKNVKLAISSMNKPEATIANFEKESTGLIYERVREIAQAPLATLQRPELEALKQALVKRLESPEAPAQLYVLRMSVENMLGNTDGITEALRQYCLRNPQNLEAASELADALAQQAYQVATADPQTSPPAEQLERAANRAAEGLWNLIEARPYVPEPYEKLIAIYNLYGQPEKAKQVTNYLTDSTTATAEEIHLAAYIMATNGMPQEAVPVYERALKIRPDHTLYRLNYAGALSRVGRLKEADAIYRDIIENGVNGRQYHAHEVYANGLKLAMAHGYKEDFLAFLRGLIPKHDMPQHDYFLVELGKVLLGLEQIDQAILFFQALETQYPDKAWEAREHLVTAYMTKKEFDKAEQVLVKSEQESTDTLGLVLARNNKAVVHAERGDLDAAVQQWIELAQAYPKERMAARGLLTAAQKLVEVGRFTQANQLLTRYLGMDTGDADGEVSARELIARVKSLDVPSTTLIQSAMQEAAATPAAQ